MTTPDVPLRLEMTFEVPGTPEQVWHAIATGPGNTSWFLPTEIEEREGGHLVFHMPPDDSSEGTVTAWDPPRRFAYEEPGWADHHDTPHTPLATEMIIEAASGGTCVLRIVSSAFGVGAEWEAEFFAEMEQGWRPFFAILTRYLTRFPGQSATQRTGAARLPGTAADVFAAVRDGLGVSSVGQQVEAGTVELLQDDAVLLALDGANPGFLGFAVWPVSEDLAMARMSLYTFGPDAPAAAERLGGRWESWLQSLAIASS